MKYLAVLGRQPEISIAELETRYSLDGSCRLLSSPKNDGIFGGPPPQSSPVHVYLFSTSSEINIDVLGGTMKLASKLDEKPLEYLQKLPEGKLTIGVSDFSKGASKKTATNEALKLKKILVRHGRSVRVVENKDAVLSTATSLHNGLSGKSERKVELIKLDDDWYKVIGVQDIDAYAKRDQARPARDAKVGMLPPKLAQILINLCGPLKPGAVVLDPFCGTGVVLQEALLMGYRAYGTDISDRMVEYSEKNLDWLMKFENTHSRGASGRPVATGGRRSSSACQPPDPLELNNHSFITKKALDLIAELSGGDARSALGDLELALSLAEKVDENVVLEAAGKKMPGYDKKGDNHYDTISAFIKSMRGSDVEAALYYLARMVEAGEDPKFIARRMVIFASEDIGLAGNGALSLATACFQAVERVGMPESGLILAHTAVALAKSKKSRATTDAWYSALELARKNPNAPVPVWLRNAPTKLMKDLGYGKGQKWEAGFHLNKDYLPDEVKIAKNP